DPRLAGDDDGTAGACRSGVEGVGEGRERVVPLEQLHPKIGSTHGPTWVAGPMRRYHRCSYGRRMNFVLTFLAAHAVRVQSYRCEGTTPSFVARRADLHGDNGKRIAIHFAGPTWKARDGSRVTGGVADRSIPWLLLAATSTTSGPDGDRLTHTTYVQRLATV